MRPHPRDARAVRETVGSVPRARLSGPRRACYQAGMPLPRRAIQLVVALLAIGCHRGANVPDGNIAATLTVPAVGSAFDPASLAGKPSLVLFVTPTCPHCLATIPRAI